MYVITLLQTICTSLQGDNSRYQHEEKKSLIQKKKKTYETCLWFPIAIMMWACHKIIGKTARGSKKYLENSFRCFVVVVVV